MVQVILATGAVFIAAAVHPGLYGHILRRNLDVLTGCDVGGGQVGRLGTCRHAHFSEESLSCANCIVNHRWRVLPAQT